MSILMEEGDLPGQAGNHQVMHTWLWKDYTARVRQPRASSRDQQVLRWSILPNRLVRDLGAYQRLVNWCSCGLKRPSPRVANPEGKCRPSQTSTPDAPSIRQHHHTTYAIPHHTRYPHAVYRYCTRTTSTGFSRRPARRLWGGFDGGIGPLWLLGTVRRHGPTQ